jgi:hypothetical protein
MRTFMIIATLSLMMLISISLGSNDSYKINEDETSHNSTMAEKESSVADSSEHLFNPEQSEHATPGFDFLLGLTGIISALYFFKETN